MKVFVSVGRLATVEQRVFLEKLEGRLRVRGFEPRTIGRNTFTSGEPLRRIKEVMRECRALIVLAFERTHMTGGEEHMGIGEPPSAFGERHYATPWHHIELAMASMLDLPILVILEKGIHQEGLLEDKYGWYVFRTALFPNMMDSDEFSGILNDWEQRARSTRSNPPPGDITVGELVRGMRPAQLWSTLVALVAVIAGSFAIGAWFHPAVPVAPAAAAPSSTATASAASADPTTTATAAPATPPLALVVQPTGDDSDARCKNPPVRKECFDFYTTTNDNDSLKHLCDNMKEDQACWNVSVNYVKGQGVSKNLITAKAYLRKACEYDPDRKGTTHVDPRYDHWCNQVDKLVLQ